MAKQSILICDHSPDFFLDELVKFGFEIDYQPDISNEAIGELPNQYDAVLIKSAMLLDRSFFEQFNKINLVLRPGSGLDNVDRVYCDERMIRVINSPNGNSNAVGEHALGLLLMMSNHLLRSIQQVSQGLWIREENRGFEIEHKRIGVIGVGNAGSAFCNKLRGLGPKLLPHDKYKPYLDTIAQPSVDVKTIFEEAEIVSLHLPLNQETRHYADSSFFNSFAKPIYFINTSRGGVVDAEALLDALNSGKVTMAALDVLETEPLGDNSPKHRAVIDALLATGKVLITPHIAGWTHEAKRKMFQILIDLYPQ